MAYPLNTAGAEDQELVRRFVSRPRKHANAPPILWYITGLMSLPVGGGLLAVGLDLELSTYLPVAFGLGLLLAAFVHGVTVLVADSDGIGRALGRKRRWSDLVDTKVTLHRIKGRGASSTSTNKLVFRGGKKVTIGQSSAFGLSKMLAFEVFMRAAAAVAQPDKAWLTVDDLEKIRAGSVRPKIGKSWMSPAILILMTAPLIASVAHAAYVRDSRQESRAIQDQAVVQWEQRRAEEAAEEAAAAARARTPSPGLAGLDQDGFVELLTAWGHSVSADNFEDYPVHPEMVANVFINVGNERRIRVTVIDLDRTDLPTLIGTEAAAIFPETRRAQRALRALTSHLPPSPSAGELGDVQARERAGAGCGDELTPLYMTGFRSYQCAHAGGGVIRVYDLNGVHAREGERLVHVIGHATWQEDAALARRLAPGLEAVRVEQVYSDE